MLEGPVLGDVQICNPDSLRVSQKKRSHDQCNVLDVGPEEVAKAHERPDSLDVGWQFGIFDLYNNEITLLINIYFYE